MLKKQFIDFKDGINNLDLLFIHPALLLILSDISYYCHINKKDFKITSIIRTAKEDKALKAVSKTHQQGRAFDMSLIGWSKKEVEQLKYSMEYKYNHLAAISAKTRKPNLIVVHDNGNGYHAHIQVRK